MWAIKFTKSNTYIHGPVYTNGSVDMPANFDNHDHRYAYLDNKPGMFTAYNRRYPQTKYDQNNKDIDFWIWNRASRISTEYYDSQMYDNYFYWDAVLKNSVSENGYMRTAYYYMYRMAYDDGSRYGKDVVVNNSNSVSTPYSAALPDERRPNPLTQAIADYINAVATDASDNGIRNSKYGKVYLDGSRNARFNMPGWTPYNVVIVDGKIHYKYQNYYLSSQNPYVILISLNGDIEITGNYGNTFKGLVYAPNGTITYTSPSNFEGSLVGNRVIISGGDDFKQNDFGFGKSGGGDGSVKLYEDNGKVYTTTASI